MVGFPMLAGFISKVWFAEAGITSGGKMLLTLITLAVSTLLNCVYFLRIVVVLYSENRRSVSDGKPYFDVDINQRAARIQYYTAVAGLTAVNFLLGLSSIHIMNVIRNGLDIFG